MRVSQAVIAALLILHAGATPAQGDPAPAGDDSAPEAPLDTVPVASAEPEAPPPGGGAATMLDDVTVTAERKVATLQDTPISMEVFNADKLALRGIDGIAGLAANVPSMTIEPFPTHNATLRMFIRGVGTTDVQVTQDSAVGVYLDGVYVARSVGLSIDTAELERVEVLRGPQGTLYGRNTTGGAINLITRRPSPGAFTMAHQLTGGVRNLYQGKSSFNVPITDDLAIKLAVLASGKDGFMENEGLGGDFADREQFALRFDARWLAADWLTADYTYDQSDLKYHNMNFQAVVPPFTSHGLADLFKSYAQTQTTYSTERLDALDTGMPHELSRSKVQGHSLILDLPVFGLGVRYIGAYRELTDDQYIDLGGGAGSTDYRLDTQAYAGPAADEINGGPTPLSVPQVYQDQISHELQISGDFFDGTLEFVAGGFLFEEEGGEYGRPVHHILTAYLDPGLAANDPNFGPLFIGLTSPRLVAFWDYDLYIRNTAEAAFLQMTWSPEFIFDGRLHLTGGVRQSRDTREAVKYFIQRFIGEGNTAGGGTVAQPAPPGVPPGTDDFNFERGSIAYTDVSPSFNLRYDVTPDATMYLTSSRAYKSGGYNIRDPQRNKDSGAASDGTDYGFGFAEGFRPEYVESMELGLKSEWFGRRLRVNADVFDSDFEDMQTNFLIAGTIADTKALNVGKAKMTGFEMETTFVALPGMLLSLDYAYLDADVLEMLDINGNNVASLYPFPSAPPHSGVASVDWSFADLGWASLRAYLGYNYMGKRDGLVIVEERRGLTELPAFSTVNARLMASGLRFGDRGTLEVGLWGRNLADEEYEIFAIDNLPQADRAVLWGEPRSLGLDLIYRYF